MRLKKAIRNGRNLAYWENVEITIFKKVDKIQGETERAYRPFGIITAGVLTHISVFFKSPIIFVH